MARHQGETIYTCDGCGAQTKAGTVEVKSWRSFSFHFGDSIHVMVGVHGDTRDFCPACVRRTTEFLKRKLA